MVDNADLQEQNFVYMCFEFITIIIAFIASLVRSAVRHLLSQMAMEPKKLHGKNFIYEKMSCAL